MDVSELFMEPKFPVETPEALNFLANEPRLPNFDDLIQDESILPKVELTLDELPLLIQGAENFPVLCASVEMINSLFDEYLVDRRDRMNLIRSILAMATETANNAIMVKFSEENSQKEKSNDKDEYFGVYL